MRARLEELPRAQQADARHVTRGRRAGLLEEAAGERARAHGRAPREGGEREIALRVPLDPLEERRQRDAVVRRRCVDDELRLPALALERDDGEARRMRS